MHLKISNFNGELPFNYSIIRETKNNYCVVSLYIENPFSNPDSPEKIFVNCWSEVIGYNEGSKAVMIHLLKRVQKILNIQLLDYNHFNNKFSK